MFVYILGDIFRNQSIIGSIFEAHVKEAGPQIGPFNSGNILIDGSRTLHLEIITLGYLWYFVLQLFSNCRH